MTILPTITIWNEYRHEREDPTVAQIYPSGIHETIAGFLRQEGFTVATATLDQPEHGLTEQLLAETDVLIWWGHMAHEEVQTVIANAVRWAAPEDTPRPTYGNRPLALEKTNY